MFTYEEAKKFIVEKLVRDAELHEVGNYDCIGADFDQYDAELPRNNDSRFQKLHIALNFWDGWQDSRNHDWLFYSGIKKGDWPRLAKAIVRSITEEQEITEDMVLRHFDIRQPREGVLSKLRKVFEKSH